MFEQKQETLKNGKERNVIVFSARTHEDISNTEFQYFGSVEGSDKKQVLTMSNDQYDSHKGLFDRDKPYWGGKFIIEDADAVKFMNGKVKLEQMNNDIMVKLLKRKYMPSVFPPAFLLPTFEKYEGVIPKGSRVEVKVELEEYTQNNTRKTKFVLLGVKIVHANEATEVEKVYSEVVEATDNDKLLTKLDIMSKELSASRKENQKIISNMDLLVEVMKEFETEIKNLKEELTSCKKIISELNYNQEETDKAVDKIFGTEKPIDIIEVDDFDEDDIPF